MGIRNTLKHFGEFGVSANESSGQCSDSSWIWDYSSIMIVEEFLKAQMELGAQIPLKMNGNWAPVICTFENLPQILIYRYKHIPKFLLFKIKLILTSTRTNTGLSKQFYVIQIVSVFKGEKYVCPSWVSTYKTMSQVNFYGQVVSMKMK